MQVEIKRVDSEHTSVDTKDHRLRSAVSCSPAPLLWQHRLQVSTDDLGRLAPRVNILLEAHLQRTQAEEQRSDSSKATFQNL